MTLRDDFVFSQSSLQDYQDCARRFELRYLLDVSWPAVEADPVLDHERHMRQGERFHHLVHQHILGIPAEALTATIDDDTVRGWWSAYLADGLTDVPAQRWPEITLAAPLGEWQLMAKYDLLAVEPGGAALIVDWKTAPRPPSQQTLAARLQTRVYRYVLALAGDHLNGGQPIPLERITMLYWYPGGQRVRLAYDAAQFERDGAALHTLAVEIHAGAAFPLTPDVRRCRFCTYRSLCDRGGSAGSLDDWLDEPAENEAEAWSIALDQIAEIEF